MAAYNSTTQFVWIKIVVDLVSCSETSGWISGRCYGLRDNVYITNNEKKKGNGKDIAT